MITKKNLEPPAASALELEVDKLILKIAVDQRGRGPFRKDQILSQLHEASKLHKIRIYRVSWLPQLINDYFIWQRLTNGIKYASGEKDLDRLFGVLQVANGTGKQNMYTWDFYEATWEKI